ncbi:MAG: hypothetical protein K9M10_00575 [Candidatus Pacebacteria bacterium]|nr:hypothetical protein [Candidatus Paceibacterota bacterium]MCF7856957.1 hypothetical protein [Candidatus Paceibacterota bacterium]
MIDALRPYVFLGVAVIVATLSFLVIGPFNMNIDGDIYVAQVEQFESGQVTNVPYNVAQRAFKPAVGVLGSLLVPFFTPTEAIQFLNLLILFALPFVAFKFFCECGFTEKEATWGAVWLMTGYPVLKYGLAISTDMGSWLFALASAYFVLKGLRTDSYRTILLASLLGFIGGTIKEPGVFGLFFGAIYIAFTYAQRPIQKTITLLSVLALPAFICETILFSVLIYAGFPTFLDWYSVVTVEKFAAEHYQLLQFAGVLASTFSILLVYALIGFISVLYRRVRLYDTTHAFTAAVLLTSLPILLWKIFISRVLFIQFIFFIPMALLGVRTLNEYVGSRKSVLKLQTVLYVLPIICSVGLFLLAGRGSLFDLFTRIFG